MGSLQVGKLPYQNGFEYKGLKWSPVFQREVPALETFIQEKLFNAPLQLQVATDEAGAIAALVAKSPFQIAKLVSALGARALIDD